jgi:hypothetical protein
MSRIRLAMLVLAVAVASALAALPAAAQASACTPARVTPGTLVHVGSGAQGFSYDVDGTGQPTYDCTWLPVSSDATWLTIERVVFSPGAPPGFFGDIDTLMAENTTGASRAGHITLSNGMGTITIVQDASACVAMPATVMVPRAGGTITIPVQTISPDCAWGVTWPTAASWLSDVQLGVPTSSTDSIQTVGPNSIVVSVAANLSVLGGRSVTLIAGGVAIAIQQEGPLCVFSMSPASLAFPAGGGSGTVALSGTGPDCSYTATPSGSVTVTSGGSGVAPATIAFTVPSTTADFESAASIAVGGATLQISQAAPAIVTDAPLTWYPWLPGGVSLGLYRPPSGPSLTSVSARVMVTNTRTPTGGWSAASDQPWVRLSAASGTTPGVLQIGVDATLAATLPLGLSSATVAITSPVPSDGTRRVPVSLFVSDVSNAAVPLGSFDSPNPSVVQSGSIPVTGWALDDAGVQRITIWRSAVPGEGGGEIYIGDAVRVRGARPDVASRVALLRTQGNLTFAYHYPEEPLAGWGYMLLSNVLPGAGTGTFTLSAYVDDLDGHHTLLGRKTITIDNAAATRPFGTIDEPAQGATVSGTIVNRGWVLTPGGKSIPLDGSTIKVYIDGALVGPVSEYNRPRPDVKAFFPNLSNSNGPEARLSIDTTALADGVHTIAWGVIDDEGAAEGIGSRFFTVQNGASSLVQALATSRGRAPLARLSPLNTDVWSREGLDDAGWATRVEREATGGRTLRTSAGQRIELFLDPMLAAPCGTYEGHLLTGDVAGPLPDGASLEAQHGIFRWQVGAATVGRFPFVFVHRGCDGAERRIPVTVRVSPR